MGFFIRYFFPRGFLIYRESLKGFVSLKFCQCKSSILLSKVNRFALVIVIGQTLAYLSGVAFSLGAFKINVKNYFW